MKSTIETKSLAAFILRCLFHFLISATFLTFMGGILLISFGNAATLHWALYVTSLSIPVCVYATLDLVGILPYSCKRAAANGRNESKHPAVMWCCCCCSTKMSTNYSVFLSSSLPFLRHRRVFHMPNKIYSSYYYSFFFFSLFFP
jgi:hypothetical protein